MPKEESKKSKRKRKDTDAEDDKKERKRAKMEEKKALLEQLPKTNEDGIAYTKIQIRRMLKRVKKGLPPIPTKEEEAEIERQEALTKKEVETLLAGHDDNADEREEEENVESDVDDDEDEGGDNATPVSNDMTPSSRKRKQRSKPVPDDYVCQACQNEHLPAHWIYDCPNKVTKRGTNQVSKRLRGIHAPDDRKVFCSGLAFDMKRKDVELLFKDCGSIVHCKLLTFSDTGRCKGQAYVTFDSAESARKARQLSGTTLSATSNDDKKKKKKTKESSNKRTDLKLKVTKVLNRTQTKQHKQA